MKKTIPLLIVIALVCVLSSLSVIGAITDTFIADYDNPYSLTQSTPLLIKYHNLNTYTILYNVSVYNSTWLDFNSLVGNYINISDSNTIGSNSYQHNINSIHNVINRIRSGIVC